jgi:lipopolysaccharide transport system permease protein
VSHGAAVVSGVPTAPARSPSTIHVDAARPSLALDLAELWRNRELVYFFVWRDLKVRYRQTIVGVGWAIVQPLMIMVVFGLLFGRLAGLPTDGLPRPVFYFAGLLPWLYFSSALSQATNCLVANQALVRKVYFPRLALPAAATLVGLADLGIASTVLLGLMLFFGVAPGLSSLLAPLFVALATLTALGLGLWLAPLNAILRDVRHAVGFVVQMWMFASPVLYPSSLVPQRWRLAYDLNPLATVIEGFRWSLTGHGRAPDVLMLATTVAVVLVLMGGLVYFRRMEGTIADVV